MEQERIIEICLTIIGCRLKCLGSEKFMGELKAIAEDFGISDREMFEICKLALDKNMEKKK